MSLPVVVAHRYTKELRVGDVRGSALTVWDSKNEKYVRHDRREVWFGRSRGWQPFHRFAALFKRLPADARLLVGLFAGFTSLIKTKACLPPVPLALYHAPLIWDQPAPTHGQLCQWGDCGCRLGKDRFGRAACEVVRCQNARCWYDKANNRYRSTRFVVCSFCSMRHRAVCMWCWADLLHPEEADRVARVWLAPAHHHLLL